ncbi:hypothetical protein [uncultured Corynebacterium sp.]|uniref:LppU/SCO3897 family protein n=1 Tax=uncultured Corynebacterium sp. TaxID=159447 RepID=UPI002595BBBF|nr:hypothetical protein [uncultured Corynebacterium sp.]
MTTPRNPGDPSSPQNPQNPLNGQAPQGQQTPQKPENGQQTPQNSQAPRNQFAAHNQQGMHAQQFNGANNQFNGAHAAAPQPEKKSGSLRTILTVVSIALILALLAGAYYFFNRDKTSLDEPLADGTCIQEIGLVSSGSPDELKRECDSPEAKAKILANIEKDSDKKCIDVPGATNTFETSQYYDGETYEFTYCTGEVDVNPEEAANTLEKSDCMTFSEGDSKKMEKKVDCGAENSRMIIGRVDNKVPEDWNSLGISVPQINPDGSVTEKTSEFCAENGFPEATEVYTLNVPTGTDNAEDPANFRTFCLQPS